MSSVQEMILESLKSNLQDRGTTLHHSYQLSSPLDIAGKRGLYCAWTNWGIRGEINSNTAFINRVLTDQKAVHLLRITHERVKQIDRKKEKTEGEEKSEAYKWDWPYVCKEHAQHTLTLRQCSCLGVMRLELMNNVPPLPQRSVLQMALDGNTHKWTHTLQDIRTVTQIANGNFKSTFYSNFKL